MNLNYKDYITYIKIKFKNLFFNKIDVETPPSIRPVINHQKFGDNFVRADAAYIIVKAKAILLNIVTVGDI